MHLTPRILHHLLKIPKYRELIEIYLCVSIRMFAFSLVGIFIPIYMLTELNFEMSKVFAYLMLWGVFVMISAPLAAKLASKIGFKKIIFLSVPLSIAYLVLLHSMKQYDIHYAWIAAISALSMEMFWMGFHIDFSRNSEKKIRGEEVSLWFSLILSTGIVAPLVGSLVIRYFGFKVLFIIASTLLLIAVIPIIFSKTKSTTGEISLRKIFRKEHIKDLAIYSAYGVKEFADSTIWPIFVYLLLTDIVKLGTISTTVALSTAIFSLISGRVADKIKTKTFIRLGALVDGISWPFRYLLRTFFPILSVTVISYVAFVFVDIPAYKKFYDDTANHTESIVLREMALTVGRLLVTIVTFLLGYKVAFWLMGLSNLAYLLL